MGQYFYIVNLTKREYIDPHRLDCGLKLIEIVASDVLNVLGLLLRQSCETGGGDIQKRLQHGRQMGRESDCDFRRL